MRNPAVELFRTERSTLDRHLPGLDKALADVPLLDLERAGNPGLGLFREAGGPALLVPTEHGGLGVSAVDAVRIQRAVGARSPSLAVATTMHHFSVSSLVELSAATDGLAWVMLQAISDNGWLLSSGFAEGRPGQHILRPVMRAEQADGGLRISGAKKPCSLTWSMDLLSASAWVREPGAAEDPAAPGRLAIILVPATSEGISRKPFWNSWILAGAESDEVVLDNVFVPEALVFYPDDEGGRLDPVQSRGFVWFELLIAAAYVGAASGLVERVVAAGRGGAADRAGLGIELEASMAALERVALDLDALATGTIHDTGDDATRDNDLLARALCVRYAVEQSLARVTDVAASLAGGMAFIQSSDLAYLLAASRPLAFHPPGRAGAAAALDSWLTGAPMEL